jgi:CheY-like chemotaxis protein
MLDISLPGMNGFEVLRALRENPRTEAIPAVALSANAMPRDIEMGRAAGFVDYLTKPIDVNQLLHTLDSLLEDTGA